MKYNVMDFEEELKNCFTCRHKYVDTSGVFGFCLRNKRWEEKTEIEYNKGCKFHE